MRANTKGKHEIRKRFAILIGLAAVGVMALGAQTVMADRAGPASHDAVPTAELAPFHGGLGSELRKCVAGRRVFLFRKRRGPDRRVADLPWWPPESPKPW